MGCAVMVAKGGSTIKQIFHWLFSPSRIESVVASRLLPKSSANNVKANCEVRLVTMNIVENMIENGIEQ